MPGLIQIRRLSPDENLWVAGLGGRGVVSGKVNINVSNGRFVNSHFYDSLLLCGQTHGVSIFPSRPLFLLLPVTHLALSLLETHDFKECHLIISDDGDFYKTIIGINFECGKRWVTDAVSDLPLHRLNTVSLALGTCRRDEAIPQILFTFYGLEILRSTSETISDRIMICLLIKYVF